LFSGAARLSERPAYTYANPETGLLGIRAICCALVAAGSHLRRKIFALRCGKTQPKPERAAKNDESSTHQ
jgi:hypothetical protein